jgi:flagellar motor switch protein FliG
MMIFALIGMLQSAAFAVGPSTLEVKKQGEQEIRKIVEPVLNQYCHDQCKIIHVESEVDLAIADETTPGFEDSPGKAMLAPASGKVKLLIDENLGTSTRQKIVDLLRDHLEELDYPVSVDTKVTKFPQPASSGYKVAELRERVTKDVKASIQSLLTQFCPDNCALGEFDLQADAVNADDVDYSSSQDYFQDGPTAIRVKSVRATIMVDQALPAQEAAGIVEMAKLKVNQFKNSSISSQTMKFPKMAGNYNLKNGVGVNGLYGNDSTNSNKDSTESKENTATSNTNTDNKQSQLTENKEQTTRSDNKSENRTDRNSVNNSETAKKDETNTNNRTEKFEHFEKVERVESGDAVQVVLDKFRVYGIVFSAIVLALLFTLVAISFRKNIWSNSPSPESNRGDSGGSHKGTVSAGDSNLSSDEKSAMLARRIEADRYFNELTTIYSEQPKVAKHVFTHVLTEEGVETTAQYLEIFGESVVMDLLRDPGLQADLSELMDFYARNTFDTSEDERLLLLKKLHHRTVSAKMQVHGSRSAALFDFLAEMDAPQIAEMVKNESNTVKAIVLTQCDQKKRQAIFAQHDEGNRLKLMTELSRIDHLPKNYIFNVATALRRKKLENPKLNTEALPGTDVLVSFMEKASVETQKTIIHQLMSSSGSEVLNTLKAKLASLETLRFMKDSHVIDVITHVKHDELVQFMQGCSAEIRQAILSKAPQDLAGDISDELKLAQPVSREVYAVVERKVLNRIKVMANQGEINLAELNERMFAEEFGFGQNAEITSPDMRRVA